jgi:hypothetical protein
VVNVKFKISDVAWLGEARLGMARLGSARRGTEPVNQAQYFFSC